jgi:hypothetical protein
MTRASLKDRCPAAGQTEQPTKVNGSRGKCMAQAS